MQQYEVIPAVFSVRPDGLPTLPHSCLLLPERENIQRIFKPFFTTRSEGQGTGLGLAAVYGTMKNHRGSISVSSEREKGTTFTLFLPSLEGDDSDRNKTAPLVADGAAFLHNRHIMVVDDEEQFRNMAAKMIEALGGKVTVCKDGREAVEAYRCIGDKVDVVILDLIMPHMDGSTAFRALKELNPDIRVLISSGYSIDGDAQQLLKEGANDFIQKPFLKNELATRLSTLLQIA